MTSSGGVIRCQPLAPATEPVAKITNPVKADPKNLVSKKFFMITNEGPEARSS